MIYKLGDLVELVTETNSDLKYGLDDIIGVTIEKEMITTIANLTETDLDKFVIVRPYDFIYNPRTHGKKIGLGYNTTNRNYIATWNNNVFRVKKNMQNIILPDYLYMYFLRERWDKEACFHSWGSSTVVFLWESFCNMQINLPSIEEQRKIVHDYKVITDRIELLKELNGKNLSYAQTIYTKFISDKANNTKLLDIVNINEKSNIQVSEADNGNYPFFTSGLSILNDSHKIVEGKNLFISTGGKFFVQFFDGDASYSTDTLSICGKKDLTIYIYLWLLSKFNYIAETCFHGSALEHLQKDEFFGLELYAPTDEEISYFNHQIVPFFDFITNSNKEINNLLKLKNVFISNLGKGE